MLSAAFAIAIVVVQLGMSFLREGREGHMLRVFENRVLRKLCGPQRDKVWETGENCTVRSFKIFFPYQTLSG